MKVKVTACKCERCSWVWLPRGYPKNRTPKKCPHCGSYYWDTPRKEPKPKAEIKDDFFTDEVNGSKSILAELVETMKEKPKPDSKSTKDNIFAELVKTRLQEYLKGKPEPAEPELQGEPETQVKDKEEIVGREPPKKDNLDILKRNCYTCNDKYKTADDKWHCTFFNYKDKAKYDRCRLCWELAEIWGEQAVGYKERSVKK